MGLFAMFPVAASKSIAFLAAIFLSGCQKEVDHQSLSGRFGVCATLPSNWVYQNHNEWIDFDTGTLVIHGRKVDVEVGGFPRFSHGKKRQGLLATSGFKLIGKEHSDNKEKLLFAYNRGEEEGPIFVMLSAPELRELEQELTSRILFVDCR